MTMALFKRLSVNLKIIHSIFLLMALLFSSKVFSQQYALTILTTSKGDYNKSVSHISLYKNKNLCVNKLDNINMMLSKGGSMGVIYKFGIISAKYKNLEKTFKCVRISNEFKTNY